jgi:ribosomal protein L3 glutamine methyltransferase
MPTAPNELTSIQDLIRWGASRFNAAELCYGHGTDNAVDEAAWLVGHALHLSPQQLGPWHGCRVTTDERAAIGALIDRRINERIPSAYLTGRTWFAGLPMLVDANVLIPRSPLAELIEQGFAPWISPERIDRVLDLCCGSGCIGIAVAAHLPDTDVDLADISPAALAVAKRNRALHGADHDLEGRVRIIESDLFAGLSESGTGADGYDIIVSNPPYVAAAELDSLPAEYRHEPRLALAAGETGLDLVLRILRDAPNYLNDDGILIVEVGSSAETLQRHLPEVPFTWLDLERGGDGIFLLERDRLVELHPLFSEAVAEL